MLLPTADHSTRLDYLKAMRDKEQRTVTDQVVQSDMIYEKYIEGICPDHVDRAKQMFDAGVSIEPRLPLKHHDE